MKVQEVLHGGGGRQGDEAQRGAGRHRADLQPGGQDHSVDTERNRARLESSQGNVELVLHSQQSTVQKLVEHNCVFSIDSCTFQY